MGDWRLGFLEEQMRFREREGRIWGRWSEVEGLIVLESGLNCVCKGIGTDTSSVMVPIPSCLTAS